MYVIYALLDPRDSSVHYVGMTDDVYKRFLAHIQCSGNNFEKNGWVLSLRAANVMVQMLELERVEDVTHARVREAYWIKHYVSLHHPVANVVHAKRHRGDQNKPDKLLEYVQGEFTPKPGGKLLSDLQAQLLITFYEDCVDVKKALARIKKDNGEGLGTGYYRHACWI